ncbi:hypothetical protein [Cupriavidus agavae]|uniref:Uncharacterized protein n=1 Tax=Cupriavidus agavae TaxID=1001822 RepID=A0A4Q7S5L7_9BURK|nr:hypothetical protein [Cupriavidus agavae]RZT41671.1 hypothetical protein EV147_0671 [Cupriavidus agavae]
MEKRRGRRRRPGPVGRGEFDAHLSRFERSRTDVDARIAAQAKLDDERRREWKAESDRRMAEERAACERRAAEHAKRMADERAACERRAAEHAKRMADEQAAYERKQEEQKAREKAEYERREAERKAEYERREAERKAEHARWQEAGRIDHARWQRGLKLDIERRRQEHQAHMREMFGAMDARNAEHYKRTDALVRDLKEDFRAMKVEMAEIRKDFRSLKWNIWMAACGTVIGLATLNATISSNIISAFESGRNMAATTDNRTKSISAGALLRRALTGGAL